MAAAVMADIPVVPLRALRSLWIQITGSACNLACRHCFNASGPGEPWLPAMAADEVRARIAEGAALGVREIYFTGGEPFLHPELLPLLDESLRVAATTVLTNGTLIDGDVAERLAAMAAASAYSLEIRVSIDGVTARANDAIRGHGSFEKALRATTLLAARGLVPIVTATTLAAGDDGHPLYDRLRALLREHGVTRPRIKILPVLGTGRGEGLRPSRRLTARDLAGFDTSRLQCAETRAVTSTGVYACPILAGLPVARMGSDGLAGALGPVPLAHAACSTCWETGLTCGNG
ncbi:MAG: radical SAM protein [Candidatus Rokubacteria bacterium]|nr:radical SAM protein [Candidatus Rokubacteria bacterium]